MIVASIAIAVVLGMVGLALRFVVGATEFVWIKQLLPRAGMDTANTVSPLISRFSLRFGIPFGAALFAAGALWFFGMMMFVPDTKLGAWLLFGPTFALVPAGVVLIFLRLACWSLGSLPLLGRK